MSYNCTPSVLNIGGTLVPITSFADMYRWCSPHYPITIEQYLSALFNNLGYQGIPIDTTFMEKNISVELAEKHSNMDISWASKIPEYTFVINREQDSLLNILNALTIWGQKAGESGKWIDLRKSWVFPTPEEVSQKVKNKIMVPMQAFVNQAINYWPLNHIFARRRFYLNPEIDKEYYYYCIRDFEAAAQNIMIKRPYILFAAGLINPEFLFDQIYRDEKRAAKQATLTGQPCFRSDADVIPIFTKMFAEHYELICKQFDVNAFKAFTEFVLIPETQSSINADSKGILANDSDPMANKTTMEQRQLFFDNLILREDEEMPLISKLTDLTDVDKYVGKPEPNNVKYIMFLKHLWITLARVKAYYPDLLEQNTKWTIVGSLYENEHYFTIYNRDKELMITNRPDFEFKIADPLTTITNYRYDTGKEAVFDPVELGIEDPVPSGHGTSVMSPTVTAPPAYIPPTQ